MNPYTPPPRPTMRRTREDAAARYRECYAKYIRGETGLENLTMARRSAVRWGITEMALNIIRKEERSKR